MRKSRRNHIKIKNLEKSMLDVEPLGSHVLLGREKLSFLLEVTRILSTMMMMMKIYPSFIMILTSNSFCFSFKSAIFLFVASNFLVMLYISSLKFFSNFSLSSSSYKLRLPNLRFQLSIMLQHSSRS